MLLEPVCILHVLCLYCASYLHAVLLLMIFHHLIKKEFNLITGQLMEAI